MAEKFDKLRAEFQEKLAEIYLAHGDGFELPVPDKTEAFEIKNLMFETFYPRVLDLEQSFYVGPSHKTIKEDKIEWEYSRIDGLVIKALLQAQENDHEEGGCEVL